MSEREVPIPEDLREEHEEIMERLAHPLSGGLERMNDKERIADIERIGRAESAVAERDKRIAELETEVTVKQHSVDVFEKGLENEEADCDFLHTRIEAFEAERDRLLAQVQRLTDLVRYKRSELYDDGLIDEKEFAAMVADSESGQRVARLEGYDNIANERDALRAQVERLLKPEPKAIQLETEDVMLAIEGTDYLKSKVERQLHQMTSGERWSLFRAVYKLIASHKDVPHAS